MLVSDDGAMDRPRAQALHAGARAGAALRAHRDRVQLPALQPPRRGRPRAARGAARSGSRRGGGSTRATASCSPSVEFMPEAGVRPERTAGSPASSSTSPSAIRLALEAEDIESRPLWKPMHLQPFFAGAPVYGGDVSARLFARGLCLPSGSALADADQQRDRRDRFTAGCTRRRRVVDPLPPALAPAGDRVLVGLLELERDGPDADLVVVDRVHRRDLDGRAGHEDLVGHVEVGADQRLLDHRVAEVLRDLDDRVAGDPRQDRRGQVRREDASRS